MPDMRERAPLGIFGGTFDPVHLGHLRLAEEAAEALELASVRWIPAGWPALRGAPRVAAAQRLEMVRLAIAGNPRFELDSAEVEAAQPSYTVPTLERLRQSDCIGSERPLVLLVGADAFAGMAGWHRWESLFELAHVGVAHRPGYPVEYGRRRSEVGAGRAHRPLRDDAARHFSNQDSGVAVQRAQHPIFAARRADCAHPATPPLLGELIRQCFNPRP